MRTLFTILILWGCAMPARPEPLTNLFVATILFTNSGARAQDQLRPWHGTVEISGLRSGRWWGVTQALPTTPLGGASTGWMLRYQWIGSPPLQYRITRSIDGLKTWQPVASNSLDGCGAAVFLYDFETRTNTSAAYRLSILP